MSVSFLVINKDYDMDDMNISAQLCSVPTDALLKNSSCHGAYRLTAREPCPVRILINKINMLYDHTGVGIELSRFPEKQFDK